VDRIRNSWQLGKISWSVLRSDKSLAVFPVLSAIASLIVIGVFAGLIAVTGLNSTTGHEGMKSIGYVFVVAAYIALAFATTYFQAALTAGANERLDGRDTSVGESIAAANAKLHRILPWALVQATASIVIRAIEERSGLFGQIVAGLLGAAWSILTFLTVPVLVLEDVGPITALKRSGTLLKQTWGENIVAQAGFGLLGLVAMLPALAVFGIAVGSGSLVVAVVFGIVAAVWIAIVSVVIAAMSGIYRTALYRFAVDGTAPAAFADADLGHAFAPRRNRGILGGAG
jgi:hypothetical protein